MSLFSSILEKLGLSHPSANAGALSAAGVPVQPTSASSGGQSGSNAAAPTPTPTSTVNVTAKLDQLAASNAQKLNWKTSIVDLLKLLNLDSSLDARKKLAQELGFTGSSEDSAQMNIWLHKAVLKKIAENGGNVPKDLL